MEIIQGARKRIVSRKMSFSPEKLNVANQDHWSTYKTIQAYCRNPGTKALILLEHEGQVEDYLESFKEIEGQRQIIALSPFAVYELDKQNISYRLAEDYYEPQEELYKLGMDNYQKVETICTIIDQSINKACPITAKLCIKPAFLSFGQLRALYDAVTIRMLHLSKIISAEKPGVIFIYGAKHYPFGISEKAPYLFFDNRESIYERLLALDGWKIPVVVLPSVQQPGTDHSKTKVYQGIWGKFKTKVAEWLQPHPQLSALVMAVRRGRWHELYHRLKGYLGDYLRVKKGTPVLLFGGEYNWNDCVEELQSVGIGPIFRMSDVVRHWLSEPLLDEVDSEGLLRVWEGLQTNSEFRKLFMWGDIDFLPAVEERLRFLVERLTPACLKAYQETSELLRDEGVRVVLSSSVAECTGRSVAEAAHSSKIPVVLWQHGAFENRPLSGDGYTDLPVTLYNDILPSDYYFAFGEGVVERYKTVAADYGTQIVPIGSSSLDKLSGENHSTKTRKRLGLNTNKKVVLYATSLFFQNTLQLAWMPPYLDNRIWQRQRSIIDILGRHNEYNIIVKMHPNPMYREPPLRPYAKDKGFENLIFIRDEYPFTELLPLADIIVLDWPQTTLLQALTTSKPIFAYTGQLAIDEKSLRLLRRRTFCHPDLKSFVDAIGGFLSGGSIDMDLDNNEFLQRYGIYKGVSGIRAAAALKNIIQGHTT